MNELSVSPGAIPAMVPSCFRSSNARRCFPTIPRSVGAAAPLFQVTILSRCATRWWRSLQLCRL